MFCVIRVAGPVGLSLCSELVLVMFSLGLALFFGFLSL